MAELVTETKTLSAANLAATVQTLPTGDGQAYGGYGDMFTLLLARAADDMPAWGTAWQVRDRMLRELVPLEAALAGAIATLAMRNATMTFSLDGPTRTADAAMLMLHASDNGAGLTSLMTKLSLDLYTQDNGAFLEVAREKYISGEAALRLWTEGKALPVVAGLNHLDAACCTRTGNPLYPVVYVDPDEPAGTRHLLPWHMVCPLAEMPAPDKRQRGRQYSAVTRILQAARLMRNFNIYRDEKTSGRQPAQISFVGGPSNQAIQDAKTLAQERAGNRGLLRYMEPLIIASLDPTKPVSVATLEWASLPAGFDYDAELRNYITLLALCLGEDYLTFAPLPGGNQGTATQSVMLERKTRGKGPALWQKLITHLMNFYGILPRTLEFSFEERDVIAEQEEADLAAKQVSTLAEAVAAGLLTVPVAQQYMADNGIILDEEYLAMLGQEDATPDETVTDEAPAQDTGDIEELPDDGAPVPEAPAEAPAAEPQEAARGGAARGSFFRKVAQALGLMTKSVDEIVTLYEVTLTDWVAQALGGRMTRVDLARAMRGLIRTEARNVYIEGLEEGGVPEEDMTADDDQAIEDWTAAQLTYVNEFAAAVIAARGDEAAEAGIAARLEAWVASFRALGTAARMSAQKDTMGTWRLGPTEEHCETEGNKIGCGNLDGKRRRLSWFLENGYVPQAPGNEEIVCGGWRCLCTIRDDRGRQLVP